MNADSDQRLFAFICGLKDCFNEFKGDEETGHDCYSSDQIPRRHFYSTSGTTSARPGHDPLAVTTLHSIIFT